MSTKLIAGREHQWSDKATGNTSEGKSGAWVLTMKEIQKDYVDDWTPGAIEENDAWMRNTQRMLGK